MTAESTNGGSRQTIFDSELSRLDGSFAAWRRRAIVVIVILYALALSPYWRCGKDSSLYLSLARSLARGEGYVLGGIPHAHVPPGFPLILAGLMRLGVGAFVVNIAMLLMGLATVLMAYLLLARLIHRDWALLFAVVFGLSAASFEMSGETLSDVPFSLVVMCGLWLYARGIKGSISRMGGWEMASLLLVASGWVRIIGVPIALGAAIGLAISALPSARRRALANLALVIIGLAASLAFFGWYYMKYADRDAGSYVSSIGYFKSGKSAIGSLLAPLVTSYGGGADLARLFTGQPMPAAVAAILLVIPVIAAMVGRVRRGDWMTVGAVAFYAGAIVVSLPMVRTRYLLPVAPLLILYLFEGWALLLGLAVRNTRVLTKIALVLAAVLLAFNIPLVARDIVEKRLPDYAVNQQHGKWRDTLAAAEFLKQHRPPSGIVLGDLVACYVADVSCPTLSRKLLATAPSAEDLVALLAKWDVRYAVIDASDGSAFYSALRAALERSGPPVFSRGAIAIYEVRR